MPGLDSVPVLLGVEVTGLAPLQPHTISLRQSLASTSSWRIAKGTYPAKLAIGARPTADGDGSGAQVGRLGGSVFRRWLSLSPPGLGFEGDFFAWSDLQIEEQKKPLPQ